MISAPTEVNKILKTRKTIRLKNYNYAKKGMYFITICVKNREQLLGEICRGDNLSPETKNDCIKIELSKEGIIVKEYLKLIVEKYENVNIDEYIIMPNHIHLILKIEDEGNQKTISQIVGQYKRNVTIQLKYSIWQKSFYEHIIRNENEYYKIKKYIKENPLRWINKN